MPLPLSSGFENIEKDLDDKETDMIDPVPESDPVKPVEPTPVEPVVPETIEEPEPETKKVPAKKGKSNTHVPKYFETT